MSRTAAPPQGWFGYSVQCTIALGVMTVPSNVQRRESSRETWMKGTDVGKSLLVKFLVRALGLKPARRQQLDQEQAAHGDLVQLQVEGGTHRDSLNFVMRGRLLSLLGWLREAPRLCPAAEWIAKADDDAYVLTRDWAAQLRLIRSTVRQPNVLYGFTAGPEVSAPVELAGCGPDGGDIHYGWMDSGVAQLDAAPSSVEGLDRRLVWRSTVAAPALQVAT